MQFLALSTSFLVGRSLALLLVVVGQPPRASSLLSSSLLFVGACIMQQQVLRAFDASWARMCTTDRAHSVARPPLPSVAATHTRAVAGAAAATAPDMRRVISPRKRNCRRTARRLNDDMSH